MEERKGAKNKKKRGKKRKKKKKIQILLHVDKYILFNLFIIWFQLKYSNKLDKTSGVLNMKFNFVYRCISVFSQSFLRCVLSKHLCSEYK